MTGGDCARWQARQIETDLVFPGSPAAKIEASFPVQGAESAGHAKRRAVLA
jgi:hypothetical protein